MSEAPAPSVVLLSGRGRRQLAPGDFPLALGGPDSAVPLAGADQPAGWLGLSEGELFVQPGPGAGRIFCNGVPLAASRWLRDRDVIRAGATRITVALAADRAELSVEEGDANATQPPRLASASAAPAGAAAPREGARIEPVAFEARPIGAPARAGVRWPGRAAVAVGTALAALGALGWFVFTAQPVTLEIAPTPDRIRFEGGLPALSLGGRHLLRPGRYTLVAEKRGYQRLEAPVEVGGEAGQRLRFALARLPGLLTVDAGVAGAAVFVDGEPAGETPLADAQVAAGEREVRVESERHLPWSESVEIAGGGERQRLDVELTPRWAEVSIDSEPPGATVRVDGEPAGTTPLTAELMAGSRSVELVLRGHKPHVRRVQVAAGEPQTLPTTKLQPSDGNLTLTSQPPAAAVSVAGRYRGETPLDLFLAPGRSHELKLSKPGHQARSVAVSLASGESRTLEVSLSPLLGELQVAATPPDAELLIDGETRGAASQVLRLLAVRHRVEIRKPGFEPYRTEVTVRSDFPQAIRIELEPEGGVPAELPRIVKTAEGHELRLVEGGRFRMGASRREPGRRANETLRDVVLTRRFYVSTTEVSNRQFRRFRSEHLSGSVGGLSLENDHHPAVRVSWQDAAAYCNWLSAQESLPAAYLQRGGALVAAQPLGKGYRLPTEAEWAWAARHPDGKQALKYPWGQALPVAPRSGNYADASAQGTIAGTLGGYDDGYPGTAPVDSFSPNALGLFNLGGNVAEWVSDFYGIAQAGGEPERDPTGPGQGEHHVIRGSSFMHSTVTELRLSFRDYGAAARPDVGFRIARYAE